MSNSSNSNHDLPPIQKIGPAVLPKPKNIKIQAGRVIRLEQPDMNNNNNNKFQKININFDNSNSNVTTTNQSSDFVLQPSSTDDNNNKLSKLNVSVGKGCGPPHRAKFVQIPGSVDTTPILSTSQLKFPRKTSSSSSSSSTSQNIPIQINHSKSTHELDGPKKTSTINFSSDGASNRPTITITTTRNPSTTLSNLNYTIQPQPQPVESNTGGVSYNIPIQYVQKSPAQRNNNNNFDNKTSNFIAYNNASNNTYTIPVNMALSNNNNNNNVSTNSDNYSDEDTDNTNNVNLNPTGNKQLFQKQQQFLNSNFTGLLNKNRNNDFNMIPKSTLDEVDLLKDLLMKNLNASSDANFFGVCTKCNDKIYGADNGLRAMDQLFHANCFACCGCGFLLQGKHFYAMEKKSYCENCYMKLLERCSLCSNAITDRILRATGKPFHPECFCCIICTKNLDGIPFTVDASNKIHCIECFHDKYAPRCYICQLSITPMPGNEETVRIVAMDKSFHVHCYKCEDCGVSLSSNAENAGGCFPLDDHILCKSCNIQRIRKLVTGQEASNEASYSQKMPRNLPNSLNYAARSTDL